MGPSFTPLIAPKLDPDTHKLKLQEEDADEDAMDVDSADVDIAPMSSVQGIQSLRNKLHAKMDQLRRNRVGSRPETKDELLEERRKQRGLMRDRRRRETKEKIRLEKEAKEKKDGRGEKRGTQHKVSAPPKVGKFFQLPGMSTYHRPGAEPTPCAGPCQRCHKRLILCCRWSVIKQNVEESHDSIKSIASTWSARGPQGEIGGYA